MSLVSNIKNVFTLATVLFLFTACGGGGGSESTTTATTVSTSPSTIETTTPTAKAVHSGQVKDSATGNGLADVKVSLGESTTTTDENGFYTLSDLTASEEAVINFEKEGYLLGSTQIQLKSLSGDDTDSSNYLEYSMHAHNSQWEYDGTEEISGAHILINDSTVYTDTEGNPHSGSVTTGLTFLDVTTDEGKTLFPGTFKGINTNGTMVQFDSYGLISLTLKDSNGNRVSIADGETVTLTFDAVSSLEKPNTLPLWYYDYEQGLWVEEGYAQLQEDGTYKGDVSHLGTWSLNRALEDEAGIYRGRIINEDGSPMSDVRVHAVGENWISSDLSTDENGMFEIEVIPGSSFQLKAYNYKNKYGANYNGTIAAIASGEIVEE